MKSHLWAAVAAVGVAVLAPSLRADEGMWLYNAPPLKQLKEKYGFEPTQGVARPPPEVERAVQQRRERQRS